MKDELAVYTDKLTIVREKMKKCKYCGSEALCKNGFVKGKQRYLCKLCERNQTEGDGREKYSAQIKNTAVTLYLEGRGFRRIARILRQVY